MVYDCVCPYQGHVATAFLLSVMAPEHQAGMPGGWCSTEEVEGQQQLVIPGYSSSKL